MRIVDKAVTPDGIEIELRDLSGEHKLPDYNGMEIVFHTVAKRTFPSSEGWYAQKGKEFRSCVYNHKGYTADMLKADYTELKNGTKTLADLKAHFWNHGRDVFVLGLEGSENYAENTNGTLYLDWKGTKIMKKTLMELLIEAGYPKEEMDHHSSDLYVYVTPLTTKVIEEWCKVHDYERTLHCPIFKDQITGKMMYDCAFQYYEN